MRKKLLSVALGGALCLFPLSRAFSGIAPSPFYTEFPDVSALQPRIVQIAASYPSLGTLSARIYERVSLIRDDSRPSWVTAPIAMQGLGIIDHASRVLIRVEEPLTPEVAERVMTVADRISEALLRPEQPVEFAPQLLRAAGHVSPGLGWQEGDEEHPVIHPFRANATSFDILARISAVLFAPQPEPPRVAVDGLDALDRISAVLFAPQPEPPKVAQAFLVMDRVSSVLGAPQVGAPDVAGRSLDILDRISAVLFAPQPEPPRVASISADVTDRISAFLFAPQPEPPKVADALNIMDRISAVLFAPQPEPPKELDEFGTEAIGVLSRVAGVAEAAAFNGLSEGTIPGLNGLTQLSKHLVNAMSEGRRTVAAAQLGAMSEISQQYAGY